MKSPEYLERLPLLWRTERMFLAEEGSIQRIAEGWLMLSPNNPTYWWGNTLQMDRAPIELDVVQWPKLFADLIHARQPASAHMTFGWEGRSCGAAKLFVDCGFTFFELIVMSATHVFKAPAPKVPVTLRAFTPADWPALVDLMVDNRDAFHEALTYREFMERSVVNWQRLAALDLGNWFGAYAEGVLVSALGVFVEQHADHHGVRLARFQQVATACNWRRRGICTALVSYAATSIALRHAPSKFIIQADANATARRIYERLGFEVIGSSFGLERHPPDAPPVM